MKTNTITCDIIQDLLPLYVDECCSADTIQLIENHLSICSECNRKNSLLKTALPSLSQTEPELHKIKKQIRRFKLLRTIGLASLAFCIALIFIALPTISYVLGTGVTYSNLNEIAMANRFMNALASKDYDTAYAYLNIDGKYKELLSTDYGPRDDADTQAQLDGIAQIRQLGFEWYNSIAKEKFLSNMEILEHSSSTVRNYTFRSVDRHSTDSWSISYSGDLNNGLSYRIILYFKDEKIDQYSVSVGDTYGAHDATLAKYYSDVTYYLNNYYQSPTLNETVCEILYGNTSFDWTVLFNRNDAVDKLFTE